MGKGKMATLVGHHGLEPGRGVPLVRNEFCVDLRQRRQECGFCGSAAKPDDVEVFGTADVTVKGDRVAAGRLFDEYHPRVYRYALAKLGEPHTAEDIAAETFARVLRDLDRFRWRGAGFDAWLFRIAHNLVMDHFRRAQREAPDDTVQTEEMDLRTPEMAALESELSDEVREMLVHASQRLRVRPHRRLLAMGRRIWADRELHLADQVQLFEELAYFRKRPHPVEVLLLEEIGTKLLHFRPHLLHLPR